MPSSAWKNIKGNPSKIVQVFVSSPLIWGIHVAKNSDYEAISELKGTSAAISRFGSGSHLMAYVNAENQQWDLEKDLHFEVINNLEGALDRLPAGQGDYFLWEKFTTKPYVDNGPFRLVGECPTPWPCFVIAVSDEVLKKDAYHVNKVLEIINRNTASFKSIPGISTMISERYDQKLSDVEQWLSLTEWSQQQLTSNQIGKVQDKLLQLDLIERTVPIEQLLR